MYLYLVSDMHEIRLHQVKGTYEKSKEKCYAMLVNVNVPIVPNKLTQKWIYNQTSK